MWIMIYSLSSPELLRIPVQKWKKKHNFKQLKQNEKTLNLIDIIRRVNLCAYSLYFQNIRIVLKFTHKKVMLNNLWDMERESEKCVTAECVEAVAFAAGCLVMELVLSDCDMWRVYVSWSTICGSDPHVTPTSSSRRQRTISSFLI